MTLKDITGETLYRILLSVGYLAVRNAIGKYVLRSTRCLKLCLIRLGFKRYFFVAMVAISRDTPSIMTGGLQIIPLSAPQPVKIGNSYYCEFLRRSRFFSGCVYTPREIFVSVLRGAKFHAQSGVLALADNRLILESALEEGRMRAMGPVHDLIPRSPKSVFGTSASIWHGWGYNYYHWWIDCLPRLYSLIKAFGDKEITLLMPHDLRTFQKESLECCLPENFQLRYVEKGAWYKAEEFLFPSFITWKACGYLPKEYLAFIRRGVFQSLGVPLEFHRKHNIYISRGKARWRRILNEDAVIDLLEDYGFRSYALEELSLREKVELFRNANIVIGPNGSGFVNILFAGQIKILDILPTTIPETHIFFLSQCLGQSYYYMLGEGSNDKADRRIDLRELRSVVDRMIDDPLDRFAA